MASPRVVLEKPEKKFLNHSKNKKTPDVDKFPIYSLRTRPIRAYCLIVKIKDILHGCTRVPFNPEVSQNDLEYMWQAYSKPLVDGTKPRRYFAKPGSMKNLLELLQGVQLDKLGAYLLSSFFTFCYFLKKYRDSSPEMTDAYNKIKMGKAPSNTQILAVIELIVKSGEKVNSERMRGILRQNRIEMKELFNRCEAFLDEVTEEDEACMKYYFRCFEVKTPIEQPRHEFVMFRNKAGEPLYVRGRDLLTLAEINAREAARISWEDKGGDEDYFEEFDNGDDVDNFEEIGNIKYQVEEDRNIEIEYFEDVKEVDIKDNEIKDNGDDKKEEIEIDKDENVENLILTSNEFCLRSQSMLKSFTKTIYKSFEKYFNNKWRSDTKFVFFDGRCIHAHAIVLENRCDAFADWLPSDVSVTSPGIINIKDIGYEVMYETIRFIYTDEVHNLNKFAAQLLEPAKKFMLEDLKVLCEEQLCNKLLVANVIDSLILAENYNLCVLKEKAKKIAAMNKRDIVHSVKFEDLISHYPKIALEIVRCNFVT